MDVHRDFLVRRIQEFRAIIQDAPEAPAGLVQKLDQFEEKLIEVCHLSARNYLAGSQQFSRSWMRRMSIASFCLTRCPNSLAAWLFNIC